MSINPQLILFSSDLSSTKMVKSGTGVFTVPALGGAGQVAASATIPHGYGSSELIHQVSTTRDAAGTDRTSMVILPWMSNDGRLYQYAYVDDTNLYIICISYDSSGSGAASRNITYDYRVLVP